jgi:hypothetical protein
VQNLGLLLFLAFLVGLLVWRGMRRPRSLKEHFDAWARWNDLIVISAQRRYFFAGPFWWRRSGIVYRINARVGGRARSGWVRFGYDFFATQPWASAAVWDDQPRNLPNQSTDPTLASVTHPAGQGARHP